MTWFQEQGTSEERTSLVQLNYFFAFSLSHSLKWRFETSSRALPSKSNYFARQNWNIFKRRWHSRLRRATVCVRPKGWRVQMDWEQSHEKQAFPRFHCMPSPIASKPSIIIAFKHIIWRCPQNDEKKFSNLRFWWQLEPAAVKLQFPGFTWKPWLKPIKWKDASPISFNVPTIKLYFEGCFLKCHFCYSSCRSSLHVDEAQRGYGRVETFHISTRLYCLYHLRCMPLLHQGHDKKIPSPLNYWKKHPFFWALKAGSH